MMYKTSSKIKTFLSCHDDVVTEFIGMVALALYCDILFKTSTLYSFMNLCWVTLFDRNIVNCTTVLGNGEKDVRIYIIFPTVGLTYNNTDYPCKLKIGRR